MCFDSSQQTSSPEGDSFGENSNALKRHKPPLREAAQTKVPGPTHHRQSSHDQQPHRSSVQPSMGPPFQPLSKRVPEKPCQAVSRRPTASYHPSVPPSTCSKPAQQPPTRTLPAPSKSFFWSPAHPGRQRNDMRVAPIRGSPANERASGRDDGASQPELGPEEDGTYYVTASSLLITAHLHMLDVRRGRWCVERLVSSFWLELSQRGIMSTN